MRGYSFYCSLFRVVKFFQLTDILVDILLISSLKNLITSYHSEVKGLKNIIQKLTIINKGFQELVTLPNKNIRYNSRTNKFLYNFRKYVCCRIKMKHIDYKDMHQTKITDTK